VSQSILEPSFFQYLLRESILFSGFFLAAKLFAPEFWGKAKENLYLLFAIIFSALIITAYQLSPLAELEAIIELIPICFLLFYFRRIKAHSRERAIIETCMIVLTRWGIQALFTLPGFYLHWDAFRRLYITFGEMVTYNIFAAILHLVLLVVVLRFTRSHLQRIYESKQMRTIFAWGLALAYLIPVFMVQILQLLTDNSDLWWTEDTGAFTSILLPMILTAVFAIFLILRIYDTRQKSKMRKEAQRNLEYYTENLEKQQLSVRRFKHDYRNILLSLDSFLETDDLPGLKEYYYSKIKPASAIVTENDFNLDRLSKIKVKEIKSILAAKLMAAENLDIDTTFEAPDEIDRIPINSVALVRMLSIILDNAIEELATLDGGKLLVACYKSGTSLTFVIQNTCRPDIPTLRHLKEVGFSSKGENRGLGLSNLAELADAYPNITLRTKIANGNFIQKLTIAGGA